MNTSNGRESYSIGLETSQFMRDVRQANKQFQDLGDKAVNEGKRMDDAFAKVGKGIASYFAVSQLLNFQRSIIQIRGEMESLQISFRNLAGEKRGQKLYEDIKSFAVHTPMMMNDLAKGAQTMLGFGIAAKDVMPILRALGDISMGNAERFNSLALAFSQMTSTGKLMGQDLLQMINAGFNPLNVIAEKTGKSIGKLKEEMSAGSISADMVKEAFISAASEGGKFYGMLESQSKSLNGAISNLQGAWEDMLNSIGQAEQGVFVNAVNIATKLVQNYETLGKVLLTLASAYGTYKAALIATWVAQKAMNFTDTIRLIAMYRKELGLATAAQQAFNIAVAANPIALATVAAAGLVAVMVKVYQGMADTTSKADELNAKIEDERRGYDDTKSSIEKYLPIAKNAKESVDKRREAIDKLKKTLNKTYPELFKNLDLETAKNYDVAKAVDETNKQYRNRLVMMQKMAEQEYQKAKEEYDKNHPYQNKGQGAYMTGSYGTSNALMNAQELANLNRLRNAADAAKKAVQEFDDEMRKSEETTVKKTTKDYEYWEKQKKQAEAELKQMDSSLKGTKAWNETMKKVANAQKELDKYSTSKDKTATTEAEKKAKMHAELLVHMDEQARERIAESRKNALAIRQNEIDAEQDTAKKTLKQIRLDYDTQLNTIVEYQEKLVAAKLKAAEQAYNKTADSKKKAFDPTSVDTANTIEEDAVIASMRKKANIQYTNALTQTAKEQSQMLLNYIKQYSDFYSQKLAITEEYEAKIREALSKGDYIGASQARREMNSQEGMARFNELKQQIDWASVFGDLGIMLSDQLKTTFSQLKDFTSDKMFRQLDSEQQSQVIAVMQQIQQKLGYDIDKIDLSKLGREIDAYAKQTQKLREAQENAVQYIESLTKAQKEYQELLKSGADENTLQNAKQKVDAAMQQYESAQNAIQQAQTAQVQAQNAVTQSATNLKGSLDSVNGLLSAMASGSLASVWEQLDNIKINDKKVTETVSELLAKAFNGKTDIVSMIIGTVLNLLDTIKEVGIGGIIGGFIQSIFGAISSLIKNIFTGEFLKQIIGSAINGWRDVFDAITFGGFSSWFGGADYSEYNELKESYQGLIDIWTELIDMKKEYISISYGEEIRKVGNEALSVVNNLTEAYRTLGKERLNAGASAGSHSIGVRIKNDMTADDWQNIAKALGVPLEQLYDKLGGRLEGLFDLTAEQLRKIKEQSPAFWSRLDGDVKEYLEGIISGAEQVQDITEQIQQQLTSTTFDGMYDNFTDSLMNMEMTAKDMANDLSEIFMKAVLDQQMGLLYKERLKSWYEDFVAAMEDGSLSASEKNALNSAYESIVAEAMKVRDELAEATGYNNATATSQNSTKGYSVAASQDSVDEVSGRLSGLMMIQQKTQDFIAISQQELTIIREQQAQGISMASEIRNLAVLMVGHLEDIRKYTKVLPAMADTLDYFKSKIN